MIFTRGGLIRESVWILFAVAGHRCRKLGNSVVILKAVWILQLHLVLCYGKNALICSVQVVSISSRNAICRFEKSSWRSHFAANFFVEFSAAAIWRLHKSCLFSAHHRIYILQIHLCHMNCSLQVLSHNRLNLHLGETCFSRACEKRRNFGTNRFRRLFGVHSKFTHKRLHFHLVRSLNVSQIKSSQVGLILRRFVGLLTYFARYVVPQSVLATLRHLHLSNKTHLF